MSRDESRSTAEKTRTGWSLIRILGAIDRGIAGFEAFILAYGILLMAANSVVNVIGRVFGRSLYFSEELNQFLIVLVTFVGLGYAARHGRHIRMSAVYDQLGDKGRKIMMIIICAVTATIMFMLAYYSYGYIVRLEKMGKVTPALQVPLYLTYVWVPIGFAITGIQYALAIVKNLQAKEVYMSFQHVDTYEDVDEVEKGP